MGQKSVRKCVEMVFGVLNYQFAILDRPSRFAYEEEMNFILRAYVIMHNIIIEIRKGEYVFDGAVRLLGTVSSHIIPISWDDSGAATTSRTTAIRSMRSNSDKKD